MQTTNTNKHQQENNVNCVSENTVSSVVNNDQTRAQNIDSDIDCDFQIQQNENSEVNILPQPTKQPNEDSENHPEEPKVTRNQKLQEEKKRRLFSYNPYQWPADIDIAKTHEAANSIGEDCAECKSNYSAEQNGSYQKLENDNSENNQQTQKPKLCPCCGKNSVKKPYNWMSVDVTKAVSEKHGTAVPLLFELIKYYGLCIFLIFCTNGVYSIYTYNNLCDLYPGSCIKMLGFLPILGDDTINKHLDENNEIAYRWLNFASYIMILISQILVDLFCDIREKKLEPLNSADILKTSKARTLYITGIPRYKSEQQAKEFLIEKASELTNGKVKLDIVDFFFVRDYSKFHSLFERRTQLYFQTKPLLELDDQKTVAKVAKLKQKTQEINQQLHDVSNGHLTFKGKAFITLRTHTQARELKNLFPKTSLRKGYTVFLSMIKKVSCFTQCATRRQNQIEKMLMMSWAPEAKEINWENLGIKNIDKMWLLSLTFILSICAAVASGLCLTYLSKAVPGFYILIFNILIMIIYSVFLEYLSEKKKGKTKGSKAYFLLSRQGFFILIYFVLLPVLYFGFSGSDSTGLKTYSLFIFFLINSGFQFLGIAINGKARAHGSFKKKVAKNPNIANQYCQKALNQQMQKPEFELEQRMIGVMQVWTYSTIHAFLCSYTLLISLLFLAIIYFCAKYMLFNQYSIYNYKTLSLQRKFLSTYSFCFQFAVLFVFQIANHTDLQRILAGVFFAVVYLGYLVFSHFRQAKLKQRRIQELLKEPLLQNEETKGYEQPADSYSVLFKQFLTNYEQPFLEEEIQNSLEIPNPFYQDVLLSSLSQGHFQFNQKK